MWLSEAGGTVIEKLLPVTETPAASFIMFDVEPVICYTEPV